MKKIKKIKMIDNQRNIFESKTLQVLDILL